ncbi:MAG TPA: hypothetical protein ENI55_00775 [Alphaproteobacteria bacterium]|nr:hypothetical protein [Alphaproteobacteria bacterium]
MMALKRVWPRPFRLVALLLAGIFLAAAFSGAAKALKNSSPSYFRSTETPSTNLKPFKKWNMALARYSKEAATAKKGTCNETKMNKCYYDRWMAFLKKIKDKSPIEQVKAVNAAMNRAKYITDNVNWGKKDYWATPGEFFTRYGDCEDYAITKYLSLKILGFKENLLRVVVLKDLNLKIGHAVLIVFLNGKSLVLDNQIKQVVEAKTIRHYLPVYSINAKNWWRHRPTRS